MKYMDKVEEAVAFRMIDSGYTPEVARVVARRVLQGTPPPEVEDIRAVCGAMVQMLWPVISSPTIATVGKAIINAVDGVLDAEIHRGRAAEAAAEDVGDVD